MTDTYDFSGWATKNNLKCADGRVIRRDAFKINDGKRVPMVWNHQHNSVGDVLGHAILENRDEGVYAYGVFNNTRAGQEAKECVKHGDVESLSIWANNLEQVGSDVLHGVIREVSLVLAGANPGAFVESVLAHGEPMDDTDEEGIFYTGDGLVIEHSIDKSGTEEEEDDEKKKKKKEDKKEDDDDETGDGDTVGETLKTLNDKQKKAVAIVVDQIIKDTKNQNPKDDEEEKKEMKHNIFDTGDTQERNYISHADMEQIIADAKRLGSLRDAVNENFQEGGVLAHALPMDGMEGPSADTADQSYGFRDPSMLFPEFKNINNGAPEFISRNMDWVNAVINGVHRTPFSRIKSVFADITEDQARAKGYIKGKYKKEEVFTLLKRRTEAQVIYKKQKIDREDMIDITDFGVVAWIKGEMRLMLDEEIARAILIGDGRATDDDDKIRESNIRPIVKDVDLFNIKVPVVEETGVNFAKTTIDSIIRGRKHYKGSGNPTYYTTEDVLTEMLLLEDGIGHKLYKSVAELATALRVSNIVTVEPMEGYTIDVGGVDRELLGVIVNLKDYNVGADKGGEINLFEDFDIDFNQYKYLIETKISGALIKPFSAMTIYRGAQG